MTQENRGTSSAVPDNLPAKRKRGRPRKDRSQSQTQGQVPTTPNPETEQKNQRKRLDPVNVTTNDMVGQAVFGVLDGSFDAGYLLTVRVGDSDTILKGIVFQPGSSVPISGSNDVVPHIRMLKRAEVPIPQVDLSTHVHGSSGQSAQISKIPDETPHKSGSAVVSASHQVVYQSSPPQVQIRKEVQNHTEYASSKAIHHAEDNANNSVPLLSQGHSSEGVHFSSQGKDLGNIQPNDILPAHPQPELKNKSTCATESWKLNNDDTTKQVMLPETKAMDQKPNMQSDVLMELPETQTDQPAAIPVPPEAETHLSGSTVPTGEAVHYE